MLLSACSSGPVANNGPTAAPPTAAPASSSVPAGLAHVVIIMEENKPDSRIFGNPAAPYLNQLAHTHASATHYNAITHPSLPNYLALTSGTTAGISTDCNPLVGACTARVKNISDEIITAGLSWKMYSQSMPKPCASANSGLYAVRHIPFVYYPDVRKNNAYCESHVVPYTQFASDLAGSALPTYSVISPNICDDMHSCPVADGDSWLQRNVPAILSSPAFRSQRSLLVITFDEGNKASNVVPCIFVGPAAKKAFIATTSFSHYALLRTIEIELGLPPLTANDSGARPMTDMLN